ncbi:hypothetical protein ACOJIV_22730 [Haloarcula sp. AONF1]
MKGVGASAVAVGALAHPNGPVQESEAVAPLILAGAAVGGSAAIAGISATLGWALRDFEIIGADAPTEGLTGSAVEQKVKEAAYARQSTTESAFIDNRNILSGVEHTAYTDAKIAAIEQLNAGASEADVLAAANDSINAYQLTIETNFLKTWNEAISEAEMLANSLQNTSGASAQYFGVDMKRGSWDNYSPAGKITGTGTETVTLSDGTDFQVNTVDFKDLGGSDGGFGLTSISNHDFNSSPSSFALNLPSENVRYLKQDDWNALWNDIGTSFQNVKDGMSLWVTNVYGDVQSGSIEISELVTPRERAAMMSEDEGMSQALADLIALNVPVDSEREAAITIDSSGAKIRGTFGLTNSADGPLESGVTYDPSTFAGDVYFTTDLSLLEGDWTGINTGVDGGTITLTAEPYESTSVEVTTTAGETVTVPAADWVDNGDGTWSYDASGSLETPITQVDSARFHATGTETRYETLQLQGSFTINKFVNESTGAEETSASFSSAVPQDDTNYITQEEWDDLEAQNQELIEKFENSQGGGGLDLSGLDMFGVPGEMVALAIAAVAALVATNR